jgi:DNA-binding NtrC family response regulator
VIWGTIALFSANVENIKVKPGTRRNIIYWKSSTLSGRGMRSRNMHSKKLIPSGKQILLVDDDQDFRWVMGNVLQAAGYGVTEAKDGDEAFDTLEKHHPDLVLLDYRMPGRDGLQVARELKERIPAVPILMITAYAEIKSAVEAIKMGICDYVTKPIDNDFLFTIQRVLEKQDPVQELDCLQKAFSERTSLQKLMGKSNPIRKLVQLIKKVAPTSFTVLVEGESGSGKELVARAIHGLSKVKEGPFVALDCGAIPESLIESELFGYMKGAFTGAYSNKPGQFEMADGGTLFLDEVGNLPYGSQQKFLRVMQERCIQRLGGKKKLSIQVRIIAATNQSLEKDMKDGTFRTDLYFRLKEFIVRVPPLRDLKEDIVYLAKKFMDEVQSEIGRSCKGFSKETIKYLMSYSWPGNVRELRNMVRQAVLLCDENAAIEPEHLAFSTGFTNGRHEPENLVSSLAQAEKISLKEVVKSYSDVFEKKIIEETVRTSNGNKSEMARRLCIDYKTMLRKLSYHVIS